MDRGCLLLLFPALYVLAVIVLNLWLIFQPCSWPVGGLVRRGLATCWTRVAPCLPVSRSRFESAVAYSLLAWKQYDLKDASLCETHRRIKGLTEDKLDLETKVEELEEERQTLSDKVKAISDMVRWPEPSGVPDLPDIRYSEYRNDFPSGTVTVRVDLERWSLWLGMSEETAARPEVADIVSSSLARKYAEAVRTASKLAFNNRSKQ